MEWLEKASFDRLNKLFVISINEQNYQILLTYRNLLVVVQEPRPYILPILSCAAPKVLVPSEHHVLNDLPFYKVEHVANAKANQDWLN